MTSGNLLVGLALTAAGPASLADVVRRAEDAGVHLLLFDDGPGQPGAPGGRGHLDPVESAAFAAALTRSIGLVATAAATHAEPFHLSNRFSSLDWGSAGRAGWLVTVDASTERARAYSAEPPVDARAAVQEADAVVDAVRRLWDSWEDEALIADSATGRFLDSDRLHYVDVEGPFFSIRGPALMPRPVQGQVVVLSRAADALGGTDVLLVPAADLDPSASRVPVLVETGLDDGADVAALLRGFRGRAGGVVLRPSDPSSALDALGAALADLVAEGTVAPPPTGQTLRERLGLPRPANRFAPSAHPTTTGVS